jgi:putative tryptophan/tyrosine transport system substrate-binding protein
MKRRDFMAALGGVLTWPLAARAQQLNQSPRLAVLMGYGKDDPDAQARIAALREGLEQFGWSEGRNIQIELRYAAGVPSLFRDYAKELSALNPDVIVADTTASAAALMRATHSVPIVFVSVTDPVGNGYVQNLARPGGNITGFTNFEFTMSGKWLEVLKDISPDIERVAVVFNPETAAGRGAFFLEPIKASASSFAVKIFPAPVQNDADIERVIAEFARDPNGGLIVTLDAFTAVHRDAIIAQAAVRKLPSVYPLGHYVVAGGLVSYGVDASDLHRRAASYVDRIIRGAKPADLPIQQPTKFNLAVNLKTAHALGLTVPPTLLARADEVIE